MYIGDPWHGANDGLLINNFTLYDGALTQDDVNKMVDKSQESSIISNPTVPPVAIATAEVAVATRDTNGVWEKKSDGAGKGEFRCDFKL
jgi:hypothetical protein